MAEIMSSGEEYVVVHVSLIPQAFVSGFMLLGATILLALIIMTSMQLGTSLGVIVVSFGLILLIVVIVAILINIYNTINTYYLLGNGAVRLVKNHLFYKDEVFYTLNENSDFILTQSIIARFFRYGTIEVNDPTGRIKMYMVNISRPQRTMNDLVKLLAEIKNRQVLMVDDPVAEQETIL